METEGTRVFSERFPNGAVFSGSFLPPVVDTPTDYIEQKRSIDRTEKTMASGCKVISIAN